MIHFDKCKDHAKQQLLAFNHEVHQNMIRLLQRQHTLTESVEERVQNQVEADVLVEEVLHHFLALFLVSVLVVGVQEG